MKHVYGTEDPENIFFRNHLWFLAIPSQVAIVPKGLKLGLKK